MPTSQDHRGLFHSSDTSDKLNLFQSLLDAHTLNSDEALALLNTIHSELQQRGGHDPSVYVRYARMMESLRSQMPAVHQEVTTKWEQLHSRIQGQVPETYAADTDEYQGKIKSSEVKYQSPVSSEEFQKPLIKEAGRIHIEDEAEIEGGGELEGPEPEEEEAEEIEGKEEEQEKEEVEKYGEEVEEEELEEKEAEEEEGREADEEETEEKEEENEEEEKEETEEEEKEEVEEKEEEGEEEEVEEEKEEVEEKEEKEEVEEKEEEQEETEKEVEAVETEESSTEADRMATEAAEAAHEMEHAEVEVEETPEVEEFNPSESEPPMEAAE